MQQRQQTGGRTKATFFLLGALIVAGITSYLVWRVVDGMREELARAQEGPERMRVLTASRDIYMGETIGEEDVVPVAMLPDTIYPELVFTEEQFQSLLNRTAKERILAGEVLREERFADASDGIGLNALIPRGLRAMTIEVDPQSSLGGHLQPGNRVDVIVTIRPDDRNSDVKWATETILQDKRVLAVGDRLRPRTQADEEEESRNSRRGRRVRPTVTLELSPEEAEKLALASSRGDMHLVLRSDIDNLQTETGGPVSANTLIGRTTSSRSRGTGRRSAAKKAPAPDPNNQAQVIEGSRTTTVEIGPGGTAVETSNRRR